MVKSITSMSRSGLKDWLVQRVSAVLLGTYAVFMFAYLMLNGDLNYDQWSGLFGNMIFKVYTLGVLFALVGHIWVGLWTVATDYLKNVWVRFVFLAGVALVNFVYFLIGATAVWGV